MKLKTLIYFLAFVSFGLVSCGGDDVDCDPETYDAEIAMLAEDFIDIAFEYAFNPTTENCEAYKQALEDYLDEVEKYESCAEEVGELEDFREAVDETRELLDDLEC